MDGGKARKSGLPISFRSLIFVMAVLAVLVVPLAWGVRRSRRAEDALAPASVAEPARSNAGPARVKQSALRDEAIRRVARRDPKEDAERVRQLAEEINSLSRIHGRIQQDLYTIKSQTTKSAAPPTLDALRDPRNASRQGEDDPDAGAP